MSADADAAVDAGVDVCDKLARDFVMQTVLPSSQHPDPRAASSSRSSGSTKRGVLLDDGRRECAEQQERLPGFRVFGAFSGDVMTSGGEGCVWTEASLNRRAAELDSAELLVVCNKLETGFDEPRLAMMYVDRHLAGARCVQVLSRANRCVPGACGGVGRLLVRRGVE